MRLRIPSMQNGNDFSAAIMEFKETSSVVDHITWLRSLPAEELRRRYKAAMAVKTISREHDS